MQFKIVFRTLQAGQLLPLSYQYELSAWIYHRIGDANHDFADFLHSQGYVRDNKRFKFFTFSNLWIPPRYEIQGDRMKVFSREISFVLSFLVPQAAQEMILGIFKSQDFSLGDKKSQLDLQVQSIQVLPSLDLSENRIQLTTTSPLMLSKPIQLESGKLGHEYLSPDHPEYEAYFAKNLLEKHKSAIEYGLAQPMLENPVIRFRLLSQKPKKRLIRIKAHTPAETKVVGYLFDFELQAPIELIRLGILAGFGGENALGFGAVRVRGGRRR